jgi:hypothetical protein
MQISDFRSWQVARSLLLACVIGIASFPARAAEATLDGWAQYKFGMTSDQVRAIPGITWDEPQANSYPPTGSRAQDKNRILPPNEFIASTMRSSSAVNKYGFEFNATALFDAQMTLNEIYALHYSEEQSPEDCEQQFQKLLEVFEMRYGTFVPDYNPVDHEHPYADNFEVTTTWRDLPGTKSRYAFLTFERRAGADKNYAADAMHVFGLSSVRVGFWYFPVISKICSVSFYLFR